MREDEAGHVVAALRRHGVVAHVAHPESFRFGVRMALGDGREAVWEEDAGDLEAQVLRDGVLVGFVPTVPADPGTAGFDAERVATVIAAAEYR